MRVQFDFTEADCLDVTKRILARAQVGVWTWKMLIYAALVTGALQMLVFIVLFSFSPLTAAIVGLATAAVTAPFYPGSHRRAVDKRLRKLHREEHGDSETNTCEVELTPAGVWSRSREQQMTFEWTSIEEILVTDDSVDFFTRNRCGLVVRKRAFQSLTEQWQFVELAKQYLEQASQAQPLE